MNFPLVYEYRNYVKNKIEQLYNDDLTAYVTKWEWRILVLIVDGA
jgi:hypothetical protein